MNIPNTPHTRYTGSAIVIVLLFIVLITILVVGFVTTAGLERKTVSSYYTKMQASYFAEMAENSGSATLQKATDTSDVKSWLSQPGRIISTKTDDSVVFVDLHSGTAASVLKDISVNLNAKRLINEESVIAPDIGDMPVKWVYVHEDGTLNENIVAAPTYDKGNPIVGRYAWWADDLSARINLNTALAPVPTPTPSVFPSDVDLQDTLGLSVSDMDALKAARKNSLFESVASAKAVGTNNTVRTAIKAHQFDLIHYNYSETSGDKNMFGEDKIVLTTRASRANGKPFIDILNNPDTDEPGVSDNVDYAKFQTLVEKLQGYMRRTDWSVTAGKSFVNKYTEEGVAQIILNIIDYVRSTESGQAVVEAARGSFNRTGDNKFVWGSTVSSARGIMGNARRPLITKVGVWISKDRTYSFNSQNYFEVQFKTEIYFPASAGDAATKVDLWDGNRVMLDWVDLPGKIRLKTDKKGATDFGLISSAGTIAGGPAGPQSKKKDMYPGETRTITMTFPATEIAATDPRPSGTVYLRSALGTPGKGTQPSTDISPLVAGDIGDNAGIPYTLDPDTTPASNMTMISVDDPVINNSKLDFTNTSTLGTAPNASIKPQQDTDSGNKLTDAAGYGFPAVKGTANNPNGMVESLVELGRVHTGGRGTQYAGTPWRTLRLQPTKNGDDQLPDWLLLDLFAVPQVNTPTGMEKAVLQPYTGTEGGLINMNAAIYPFSENNPSFIRKSPLIAALRAKGSTISDPASAAGNIIAGTLANKNGNKGRLYGKQEIQDAKLYFAPEQIVEIDGVTDSGEESEKSLVGILPHLTTKGSVFSVFAVGQKIRQFPDGTIKVQSESRTETILERRGGSIYTVSEKEVQ